MNNIRCTSTTTSTSYESTKQCQQSCSTNEKKISGSNMAEQQDDPDQQSKQDTDEPEGAEGAMGLLSALLSQLNFRKSAQTEETEEKPQQVLESLDLQGVAKYIESGKEQHSSKAKATVELEEVSN
ncbi:hypothetical protein BSL78_02922 [Apostichopus japonicus]|uniref:Uncharacterized protein n=1 Tax=Stichopus japonicus TaxID=307972 RepID=A0A2G8LJ40_STIJA|nr:hypothetical protein BSL78_02922 [Apostichopus japonicus]